MKGTWASRHGNDAAFIYDRREQKTSTTSRLLQRTPRMRETEAGMTLPEGNGGGKGPRRSTRIRAALSISGLTDLTSHRQHRGLLPGPRTTEPKDQGVHTLSPPKQLQSKTQRVLVGTQPRPLALWGGDLCSTLSLKSPPPYRCSRGPPPFYTPGLEYLLQGLHGGLQNKLGAQAKPQAPLSLFLVTHVTQISVQASGQCSLSQQCNRAA